MDTTASAISRSLWILAQRQDVQDKICSEMRNARMEKGGGDLTYDELVALPYLDAVCKETLRVSVCLFSPSQPFLNVVLGIHQSTMALECELCLLS